MSVFVSFKIQEFTDIFDFIINTFYSIRSPPIVFFGSFGISNHLYSRKFNLCIVFFTQLNQKSERLWCSLMSTNFNQNDIYHCIHDAFLICLAQFIIQQKFDFTCKILFSDIFSVIILLSTHLLQNHLQPFPCFSS